MKLSPEQREEFDKNKVTEIEKAQLLQFVPVQQQLIMRKILLENDLLRSNEQVWREENAKLIRSIEIGDEIKTKQRLRIHKLKQQHNQTAEMLNSTIADIEYQVQQADPHPALLGIVATVNTFKKVLSSLSQKEETNETHR